MSVIITRYLIWETFKSQLAILFILSLIFFCQKLVRILDVSRNNDIPINLIFSLLGLGVPEMLQLILPLSLFLGLLMIFNHLYVKNEIIVIYACGLGKSVLIRVALVLSILTALFAVGNVTWLSPWFSRHQEQVLLEAKANPGLAALAEGQFCSIENGNSVLFISNIKDKQLQKIFLAHLKPNGKERPSVVIAARGYIKQRVDGSQLIILEKGTRYEGTALLRDFRITSFAQYQALINYRPVLPNNNTVEQMTLYQLWDSLKTEARAELHWRLTLVVSVLIMAMMAVPLSVANLQQRNVSGILPAILLYLIFFLLQTALRSNGAKGKLNPMLWMWLTNLVYLMIVLILNLFDSIPARKLRRRLLHMKGAP